MNDDELSDRELLLSLSFKINEMKKDVDRLTHVLLEGNGKPAITEQVLTNKFKIERLEEERNDKKLPRVFWVGLIVPSILSIVGIAVAVI